MSMYITSTAPDGRTFFYGIQYEHIEAPPRFLCVSWDDAVSILKERGLPLDGYSGYVDGPPQYDSSGKCTQEKVFSGFNYFVDANGKVFAHHHRDLGTLVIY